MAEQEEIPPQPLTDLPVSENGDAPVVQQPFTPPKTVPLGEEYWTTGLCDCHKDPGSCKKLYFYVIDQQEKYAIYRNF